MKQRLCVSILLLLFSSMISRAQAPTAVVNGQVRDTSGAAIAGATVEVFNDATHLRYSTETNDEGIYSVPNLPPGTYHIQVSKPGFKTVIHPDIVLNIQDAKAIGLTLPVGPISDTVTVEGGAPLINTQDSTVSTLVDRQFAENLPLNGRSFQTLIQLTPGVVLTGVNGLDSGQFSVNGQRASSNYWMVDGVSANIGLSPNFNPGNTLGGTIGSFSALGGTNSLVSVDALQEFRILTSTYAPEFGRTPGGQISIVTRSGTNQYHGTVFDYLRNDVFDANNWFNGFTNNPPLPKAKERQNDFGGTFGGPILKDHTFFFFSYEGLRLRLPQTTLTTVPDLATRQNATPTLQPYLNAFPLDPNQPDLGNGVAQFNASYSNPASLDAYSLRIDKKLGNKVALFGRYNYSPSEIVRRGGAGGFALSTVTPVQITTQTGTVGATWAISSQIANELRFNYSRTTSNSYSYLDKFGGAVPLSASPFPSPFTGKDAYFQFDISSLSGSSVKLGKNVRSLQRQINLIDSLSFQKGSHSLKFGADFRRLSPLYGPADYTQTAVFSDVPSAEAGTLLFGAVTSFLPAPLLLRNLGVFVQDTWRAFPRLTLTFGLRWDVDFAPSTTSGASFPAANNFNNLANLALAPPGTQAFKTPFGNVAPRLGVAYQLSQNPDWGRVLRGGFGVFFDLATSEVGSTFQGSYPFGATSFFGGNFPLDPATAAPPLITPANLASSGVLAAFDPHLQLPYTLQWNLAFEQALGRQQTVSASYIGSVGRRLIQTAFVISPNQNLGNADLISNAGQSDYDALQIQFQRRLSRGLQVLASYTWSHSIDDASAGSFANPANGLVPSISPRANRGPSDFDIRNAFSAGVTYKIPAPKVNKFTNAILRGWSLQNVVQARSASPVNVYSSLFGFETLFNAFTLVRPDVVNGVPFYLYGPQYPGGKILNNTPNQGGPGCIGPFCPPPTDPNTGAPLRQGNLGRNALRGFGAAQWDFAVHRDFLIHESLKLQFLAEMFNVLNHPNFGPPVADLGDTLNFGYSTQMLGQSLAGGNVGSGAFSPLYQIGGPRSIQLALKLQF